MIIFDGIHSYMHPKKVGSMSATTLKMVLSVGMLTRDIILQLKHPGEGTLC